MRLKGCAGNACFAGFTRGSHDHPSQPAARTQQRRWHWRGRSDWGTQGCRRRPDALRLLPMYAAWYDVGLLATSPGRAPAPPDHTPPPLPDMVLVTAPHG